MLEALESFFLHGTYESLLSWIGYFLSKKKKSRRMGNFRSDAIYGLPQRENLLRQLFSVFSNDIEYCFEMLYEN